MKLKYKLIGFLAILLTITCMYNVGMHYNKSQNKNELKVGDKFPLKEFVNDLQDINIKRNEYRYYMYRYLIHDVETGNICDMTVAIGNDSILLKRIEPLFYSNKLEIIFKDTVEYVNNYK